MFQGIAIRHFLSGFIAVMVGFASSIPIVFQAAYVVGANEAELSSWVLALGLGMGISTIGLSLYYRMPVLTAWSASGAALLVTGLQGYSMAEAIGVFLFVACLVILCGVTGWFERITRLIPLSIASAMLAGVLFRFGIDVYIAMETEMIMVGLMFLGYLVFRRFVPRYAVILVLIIGLLYAFLNGQIKLDILTFQLAEPVWIWPEFTPTMLISVGIPLFIVTMTSQNLPGIATMRTHGYNPPLSPIITVTGVVAAIMAPFGGFSLNLAAITAAICMGDEVDSDPRKRYFASFAAGLYYMLLGIFGTALVYLFAALPKEMIYGVAGLALLSTIGNGLSIALERAHEREPALITFLVTASGVSLFSVGAAFWGIVAGVLARWIANLK